jgi:hypothetical protein
MQTENFDSRRSTSSYRGKVSLLQYGSICRMVN